MLTSIAGKSVIVTGASKGIGKGIARVFCQNGAKVMIVSRHIGEAEACADELRRAGGAAEGYAADVTKQGEMDFLAEAAAKAHGGIDILCANAGIFPQAKIDRRGVIQIRNRVVVDKDFQPFDILPRNGMEA